MRFDPRRESHSPRIHKLRPYSTSSVTEVTAQKTLPLELSDIVVSATKESSPVVKESNIAENSPIAAERIAERIAGRIPSMVEELIIDRAQNISVVRENTPVSASFEQPIKEEKKKGKEKDQQKEKRKEKGAPYIIFSALFLFAFVCCQGAILFFYRYGPSSDEALAIAAGLRAIQGKGVSDGYLAWLSGSLFWPMIAGFGYTIHGLFAVRSIAVLLAFVALLMVFLATQNLFGPSAACFTVVALIFSAPFMALAHLGVDDVPAIAFTATSLWCVTQLKHDHRIWLSLSAFTFSIAVMSLYSVLFMLLPVLVLILVIRKQQGIIDICLFLFIFFAFFLAFFLPVQYQLGDWLFPSLRNAPAATDTIISLLLSQLCLGLIPFIFVLLGFVVAPRKKEALVLLLSGLIWPAYHLISKNSTSDQTHVVIGFLFTYPLIGLFCAFLWRKRWWTKILTCFVVSGFAYIGVWQLHTLDLTWPDLSQPATYLTQHVQARDILLINDSWPYTMYLYGARKIDTPGQVIDDYSIVHAKTTEDICHDTWYITETGGYAWPDAFTKSIKACHSFIPVYHATSGAVGFGPDHQIIVYQVTTTIYKNISTEK